MHLTMIVCDHSHVFDQIKAETDLDVVIEDKVVVTVPLQKGPGMLLVEVLKLQHCLGPPPQDGCHKLIHQLQPPEGIHVCCAAHVRPALKVKQHATDLCVKQSRMHFL